MSWLSSVQSHGVYLDPEDPGEQGCPRAGQGGQVPGLSGIGAEGRRAPRALPRKHLRGAGPLSRPLQGRCAPGVVLTLAGLQAGVSGIR